MEGGSTMEQGVILLQTKNDRDGIRSFAFQLTQIVQRAMRSKIKLVDYIIIYDVKDVAKTAVREVTKLDAKKRFDSLLIYSPSQICRDAVEYQAFVALMAQEFQVKVRYIRSNF